jgi:A/G-specific adenine glycosylase
MPAIQQKLLGWYDKAARKLPWRGTCDPYAVWVSEIMLQQTRVETVVPYYERFLERFPTAEALAAADEDSVLSMWSGLGYYRRARLLHAGVREVVAQYGGRVPEDAEARRALPGVGRYTAGAIGSIAFDKREPVVDGNVTRVLARLFRVQTPVGASATTKRMWEEAENLVPEKRPGDFNQALMELGATLCTPRQPSCPLCPLNGECEAYAHDEVDTLPVPKARKAPVPVRLSAVVATSGRGAARRVWLVKGSDALFGGLWGVPTAEGEPRQALRSAGVQARLQSSAIAELEHVLSHRKLQVTIFRATAAKAEESANRRAFLREELSEVGISSLTQKLLEAVGVGGP